MTPRRSVPSGAAIYATRSRSSQAAADFTRIFCFGIPLGRQRWKPYRKSPYQRGRRRRVFRGKGLPQNRLRTGILLLRERALLRDGRTPFAGEGTSADGRTPFAGEGTSADGRTPFAGEGTSADGRAPFAGEGTSADGHTSEGERISAGKRLQREAALQPPLRDMEAAGAFQAASLFLAPHQIVIAKVVSDGCDEQQLRRITPASVAAQITAAAQPLLKWLCSYSAALSNERSAESSGFAPEDTLALQRLCASLRLSVTQCAQLRQLLQYYRSLHARGSITLLTDRFLRGAAENSRTEKGFAEAAAALLPDSAAASASGLPFVCRTKKEGKAYFAQLRHCIAPTVFPPYLC